MQTRSPLLGIPIAEVTQGSPAKPTRREKREVWLMSDFNTEKKPQVYPLRYIEDFFSVLKSLSDQISRFVTGRGFAGVP